jgi:hypothetical protein
VIVPENLKSMALVADPGRGMGDPSIIRKGKGCRPSRPDLESLRPDRASDASSGHFFLTRRAANGVQRG